MRRRGRRRSRRSVLRRTTPSPCSATRSRGRIRWRPNRPCCGCRPSPDAEPRLDDVVGLSVVGAYIFSDWSSTPVALAAKHGSCACYSSGQLRPTVDRREPSPEQLVLKCCGVEEKGEMRRCYSQLSCRSKVPILTKIKDARHSFDQADVFTSAIFRDSRKDNG